MGNYDRDAHLRMQMPHRPPTTATATGMGAHQLPTHRVKPSNSSGNNLNTGPYFHHLLERTNSSGNSSTNSLLFNPCSSYAEPTSNTTGKRPRSSNSGNNGNNGNSGNFLSSFEGIHLLLPSMRTTRCQILSLTGVPQSHRS